MDGTTDAPVEKIDARGSLEVMDPTGHFEIRWDGNKADVDRAEATFKDLLSKGYVAFKKRWLIGGPGKQATEFDPKAGSYLFSLAAKAEKSDDPEVEHEQTKEFDPKGDQTMVPPLRGG